MLVGKCKDTQIRGVFALIAWIQSPSSWANLQFQISGQKKVEKQKEIGDPLVLARRLGRAGLEGGDGDG